MKKRTVLEIIWDVIVGFVAFNLTFILGSGLAMLVLCDQGYNTNDFNLSMFYIISAGFAVLGLYLFYFFAVNGGKE